MRPRAALEIEGKSVAVSRTNSCLRASRLHALFAQTKTTVPGMSQVTDAEFGFSFWYPEAWKMVNLFLIGADRDGVRILQNGDSGNMMCLRERSGRSYQNSIFSSFICLWAIIR